MKHPKKDFNEVVRNNVRKSLRDILINRCKETMMAINLEAVGQISKKIEYELLKLYGETGQKYKTKYRSLIFNLKDAQNKVYDYLHFRPLMFKQVPSSFFLNFHRVVLELSLP